MERSMLDNEYRKLLDEIHATYGYDYREYAPDSVKRRVTFRMRKQGVYSLDEFRVLLRENPSLFSDLVDDLSIGVTSFFRTPTAFKTLQEVVFPKLATYPMIRVWSAGAATGEEAYSLAIALSEAGLYERTRIYATDINPRHIERAHAGVYALDRVFIGDRQYNEAGGRGSLFDYFTGKGAYAEVRPALRKNIVFSTHNLATDSSFNEFHLILCRNVLIYFTRPLFLRALRLVDESLIQGGYFCLGDRESMVFSPESHRYDCLDRKERIYRKRPFRHSSE